MMTLPAGSTSRLAALHSGRCELLSRARSYLRRGLFLSAALHVALLGLVLRATERVEEALVVYRVPADLIPAEAFRFVPPPAYRPTVAPPTPAETGILEPVPSIPEVERSELESPLRGIVPEGPSDRGPGPSGTEHGAPLPPAPAPGPDEAFQVSQVDVPPIPVHAPKPRYPEWEKEAGIEGRVLLHALVGADGTVKRVVIVRDVRGLGKAAQEAIYLWRFTPGRMGAHAVPVWTEIPVVFRLD